MASRNQSKHQFSILRLRTAGIWCTRAPNTSPCLPSKLPALRSPQCATGPAPLCASSARPRSPHFLCPHSAHALFRHLNSAPFPPSSHPLFPTASCSSPLRRASTFQLASTSLPTAPVAFPLPCPEFHQQYRPRLVMRSTRPDRDHFESRRGELSSASASSPKHLSLFLVA